MLRISKFRGIILLNVSKKIIPIHKYSTVNSVDEKSPLSGIRILDLTRIVAGPYCTMILGDLGAEIIKIERPEIGDESRHWGPPFLTSNNSKESTYFMSVNRNKKSICIDLKKGKNVIYELAKKSDVIIENYIPGKLAEYELDFDVIKKYAPHIIYCSLTGYGYSGPYANRPGYDVIAASIGGLMDITGPKNGEPCKPGVAVTDLATGLYAHGAIMAALIQRTKTNKGQWIQCNLLSTQIASLINIGSNYLNANKEGKRWGSEHESIVPYEAFQTKDGFMTIGTGSDAQFIAFLDKIGLSEYKNDERFLNNTLRVKYREELLKILRTRLLMKTNVEWSQILKGSPFPYGPVNSIKEVFDDEHVKSIGIVKEMEHSGVGKIKVVGPPVTFSYGKNEARLPPPMLGQHTQEILKNILNYPRDIIDDLIKNKTVQ